MTPPLRGDANRGAALSGGAGHDHTTVGRPVLDSPSDYLLAGLLTIIGVVTVGVWATGQTAALITGHGWPHVPLTDGLGIATRLPRHLSDPATCPTPPPPGPRPRAHCCRARSGWGSPRPWRP